MIVTVTADAMSDRLVIVISKRVFTVSTQNGGPTCGHGKCEYVDIVAVLFRSLKNQLTSSTNCTGQSENDNCRVISQFMQKYTHHSSGIRRPEASVSHSV